VKPAKVERTDQKKKAEEKRLDTGESYGEVEAKSENKKA
jgi:hypothetical protein